VFGIGPGSLPPPANGAGGIGTLLITGQGFRGNGAGITVTSHPPGLFTGLTLLNATALTVTCNASVWYWSNAALTLTQLGYTSSATKPTFANATLNANATAATLPYGAPVQLAGYLLGDTPIAAVVLQRAAAPAATPPVGNCSYVAAVGSNGTRCIPVLLPTDAFGIPLTVWLRFSVGASLLPVPGVTVTVTRPTAPSAATARVTTVAPGARTTVVASVPVYLPYANASWTTAGTSVPRLQLGTSSGGSGGAWLRGGVPPPPTTWTSPSVTGVGGAAPTGDGASYRMRVVLGGGTLTATGPAAYTPPTVDRVQPAQLDAVPCASIAVSPGALCAPPTTVTLVGTGLVAAATGAVRIANVSIAQVPCTTLTPDYRFAATNHTGNGSEAVVLRCAWPGTVLDGAVAAVPAAVLTLPLALAWTWQAADAAHSVQYTVTDDDDGTGMRVVVRPRLLSVVPSIVTPGSRMTISATHLVPSGSGVPTITFGGVPCTGLVVVDTNTVACDAPSVSALTPGYPLVAVAVSATSGMTAPVVGTVSYTSAFDMVWASLPPATPAAATVLLPSGRQAGGLMPWPTVPTVVVTGVGSGSCWVEVVNMSTGGNTTALDPAAAAAGWVASSGLPDGADGTPNSAGLVGTTAVRVRLDATQPLAVVAYDATGLTGGGGTTAAITATCLDERGRVSSVATPWLVALGEVVAGWDAGSTAGLAAPVPPVDLPVVNASVAWLGVALSPANATYAAAARQLSCTAAAYAGSAGAPTHDESLAAFLVRASASVWSVVTGTVSATAECDAAMRAALPAARPAACWHVSFDGLSLDGVPLATPVALAAECVWVPTGERVRLPVLAGVTVTANVTWALPARSDGATAVYVNTPVTAGASIVHNVPPHQWPSAAAVCSVVSAVGGSGDAALTAAAAARVYGVDGATGALTPATVVEVSGTPGASLPVALTCRLWGIVVSSRPRTIVLKRLYLQAVGPQPTTYIPTDGTVPLALTPPPAWRLVDSDGEPVVDAVCSLAAASNGAEVVALTSGGGGNQTTAQRSYAVTPGAGGAMTFDAAAVVSSFSTRAATLAVSCTRPVPDAPEPHAWELTATRLSMVVCAPPAAVTNAASELPPVVVGIAVDGVSPCGGAGGGDARLATARPWLSCAMVPVSSGADAGGVTAAGDFMLFVSDGTVSGADGNNSLVFDRLQLIGSRGVSYNVSVSCSLGSLTVPGTAMYTVQLDPCPAGYFPSGMFCSMCPTGTYTRGRNERVCLPCPAQGAVCEGGLLKLQANYYRAADEAGTPVSSSSQLSPCYNTEACVFNASTEAYSCAAGYTGALCGVCDARAGYGMFGSVCRECWSAAATWVLFTVVVIAFVGLMGLVALSPWMQAHDDSAVALKLLIGYVQAAASLTVITAGGEQLFRSAFGWTSYASASPFSLGALQCQLQWGVLARYVAVVCIPVVAVACAVVAAVVVKGVYAVTWHRGIPVALDVAAWAAGMREWRNARRPMATCAFVAFVSYMPIITASFDTLTCDGAEVDGARWLYTDLSVQCFTGQHAVTMALAVLVLIVVGAGTPAVLLLLLGRVHPTTLHDPAFANSYAFLYQGYRASRKAVGSAGSIVSRQQSVAPTTSTDALTPHVLVAPALPSPPPPPPSLVALLSPPVLLQWLRGLDRSLLWWEAAVMLRKAGTVMLATVVTDKFYQVVGAVLLFAGAMALQQHYMPYAHPLFNALEAWVLLDLYVTAAVSTVMLPAIVAPANEVHTATSWETGLKTTLVMLNLATLLLLVGVLIHQSVLFTYRTATTVQWVQRRVSVSVASLAAALAVSVSTTSQSLDRLSAVRQSVRASMGTTLAAYDGYSRVSSMRHKMDDDSSHQAVALPGPIADVRASDTVIGRSSTTHLAQSSTAPTTPIRLSMGPTSTHSSLRLVLRN